MHSTNSSYAKLNDTKFSALYTTENDFSPRFAKIYKPIHDREAIIKSEKQKKLEINIADKELMNYIK